MEELTAGEGLILTGTTLKSDAVVLASSTTQTGPVNTTTPTALFTHTIPANSLVAGDVLRLTMTGTYGNNGQSVNNTLRIKLGGTNLIASAAYAVTNASANTRTWTAQVDLYIQSTTAQKASYFGLGANAAVGTLATSVQTGNHPMALLGYGTGTVDLSSDRDLVVECEFSLAHSSVFIYAQAASLVKLLAP